MASTLKVDNLQPYSASSVTVTSLINSALTSGRVPYSTTSGLQTDSANLTFNGTTLTAHTLTVSTGNLTVSAGVTALTKTTAGDVLTFTNAAASNKTGYLYSNADGVSLGNASGQNNELVYLDRTHTRVQINAAGGASAYFHSGYVTMGGTLTDGGGQTWLHITSSGAVAQGFQLTLESKETGYGAGVNFASRTSAGGTLVSMGKICFDGEAAWNTTATTQDSSFRVYTAKDGALAQVLRLDSEGFAHMGAAIGVGVAAVTNYPIYANSTQQNSVLYLTNTNATTAYGLQVDYLNCSPNDASHDWAYFRDNAAGGTVRARIYSNGGLANFQANDVNLSDERVKPTIEPLSDALLDKLEGALVAVDWGRFKYADQSHDDWNYGYTAQGVAKAFAEVFPEIVDDWETQKRGIGEDTSLTEIPPAERLKAVYSTDLMNISMAVLARLAKRVAILENRS